MEQDKAEIVTGVSKKFQGSNTQTPVLPLASRANTSLKKKPKPFLEQFRLEGTLRDLQPSLLFKAGPATELHWVLWGLIPSGLENF